MVVFHDAPEVAGEVVLEAAAGLAVGAGDGLSAVGVVAGAGSRTCRTRLSWRSPPRLNRWRVTRPEDACSGVVPASIANAAADRQRPGCDQETSSCAAATGPTPNSASSSGIHDPTRAASWALFAARCPSSRRTTPASWARLVVSTSSAVWSVGASSVAWLIWAAVARPRTGRAAARGGQHEGSWSRSCSTLDHQAPPRMPRRPAGAGSCGMPLLPVSHRSGPKHGGSDAGS